MTPLDPETIEKVAKAIGHLCHTTLAERYSGEALLRVKAEGILLASGLPAQLKAMEERAVKAEAERDALRVRLEATEDAWHAYYRSCRTDNDAGLPSLGARSGDATQVAQRLLRGFGETLGERMNRENAERLSSSTPTEEKP